MISLRACGLNCDNPGRRSRGIAGILVPALVAAVSLAGFSSSAWAQGPTQSGGYTLEVTRAAKSIYVGGDSNSPAVWLDGELRVYASNYPSGGSHGGAEVYRYGPALDQLTQLKAVRPDRSRLDLENPEVFGPWFESVLADGDGVLWAFYHAEFQNSTATKIHPRIGIQRSADKGATWSDLGIVLDTPEGTDQPYSRLGYGFNGGNGDFSVILDRAGEYLYFFFTQYGANAETQGLAVARMRWSERGAPVGRVEKWHDGTWSEPGVGGRTTALLSNVGDAHGLRAPIDFWWGPSIHWNTHLERYVILLNRGNTEQWTYAGGPANWFMVGASLDNPSSWSAPAPIQFPGGFNGGWYPQVIGTGSGETDRIAGQRPRVFVSGYSEWQANFAKADGPPDSGNTAPVLSAPLPAQSTTPGVAFSLSVGPDAFYDAEGDALTLSATGMPGWLSFDPVTGVFNGSAPTSGVGAAWQISVTATDVRGLSASTSFTLTVMSVPDTGTPEATLPQLNTIVRGGTDNVVVPQGAQVDISATATDADGDLKEHWLEIRNPLGEWSWMGWLTSEPWAGALNGTGYSSTKTTKFMFAAPGTYIVRSTAIDSHGVWCISNEVQVTVQESPVAGPSLPSLMVLVNGLAEQVSVASGQPFVVEGQAHDRDGDMVEHWLEVCRPDGTWSWEGWLVGEPWAGALVGDSVSSVKKTTLSLSEPGMYLVRTTAIDGANDWIVSGTVAVNVGL